MMLTYEDLVNLFPNKKRFNDPSHSLSYSYPLLLSYSQPKGIFIPLYHDSGELQEAIANGAIGTLWEYDKAFQIICPIIFLFFMLMIYGKV